LGEGLCTTAGDSDEGLCAFHLCVRGALAALLLQDLYEGLFESRLETGLQQVFDGRQDRCIAIVNMPQRPPQ
jgi:hypothetical protein